MSAARQEVDAAMLAMWDAKMSTASIAQIMGRSEARVHARLTELRDARRALAAARETAPAPAEPARISIASAPEAEPAIPAARVRVTPPTANEIPLAGGPEPEVERGRRLWTAAEDDILRRCWREHPGHAGTMAARMLDRPFGSVRWRAHMLGLRQDGAPRTETPSLLRPTAGGVSARPVRHRPVAQRIKPLTPEVLRFAGWFHVADWPADEIADLFDLDADELGRALGVAA